MSAREFWNSCLELSTFLAQAVRRADWKGGVGLGRAQLGMFPVPFHLLGEDTLTLHSLDQAEALV